MLFTQLSMTHLCTYPSPTIGCYAVIMPENSWATFVNVALRRHAKEWLTIYPDAAISSSFSERPIQEMVFGAQLLLETHLLIPRRYDRVMLPP